MQMAAESNFQDLRHLYSGTVKTATERAIYLFFVNLTIGDAMKVANDLGSWSKTSLTNMSPQTLKKFLLRSMQYMSERCKFHHNYLRWSRIYFYPIIKFWIPIAKKNKMEREKLKLDSSENNR
jgi:hypothetical protein